MNGDDEDRAKLAMFIGALDKRREHFLDGHAGTSDAIAYGIMSAVIEIASALHAAMAPPASTEEQQ